MKKVFLLGAGSWGTALAKIILDSGNHQLIWHMRKPDQADEIMRTGRNAHYLSHVHFDVNTLETVSGNPVIPEGTDALIVALPAAFSAEVLQSIDFSNYHGPVISAAKGLIPDLHLSVTEWLELNTKVKPDNLFMIGGPCHSEEVAQEKRSFLTLAGNSMLPPEGISNILTNPYVSCHTSTDLRGIESAAVLKNVMALACGIALGTGRGDNFLAVLVSAASRETERFLQTHFPLDGRNINESAYLGDLLVTCFSPHSRNRSFGMLVGRGYSASAAKTEMAMVAEGYYAIKGLATRFGIAGYPIMEMVYQCLYQGVSARTALSDLEKKLQ